jgi:mono/diheme cytochrome c family protein
MRNVAATLASLTVPFALAVFAAEPESSGRGEYLRYCSACHGPEAKGDGVVAGLMRPSPPDLTALAARHGGEFPMTLVVRAIDGREIARAHGTPVMPVWGEILGEELAGTGERPLPVERRVHARIYAIAEYLRSLQTK